VRVYRPTDVAGPLPAVLYIHAGGFIAQVDAVVVSVEYRLAPEHRYPAAVEDCYAGLQWLAAKAEDHGVDADRIAVYGTSAGGGLAAGVSLLARDRGGPRISFLMLDVPELDDRLDTPSMRAYTDTPIWNRPSAVISWTHYLGESPAEVPIYAAPARATDLAGMPPTYIAVAQFDPLRDEALAFAGGLLQAGVPTELHCFPGTFHGSTLTPFAAVSQRQLQEMSQVLRRALHP
jgi:acetyl esterase/lipase